LDRRHSLGDKRRYKPDRMCGNMVYLLGTQMAVDIFGTSGPHPPLLDSHRCEVHDDCDVDHMFDKPEVCFQIFEIVCSPF